jgi:hypothetical protein
MLPKSALLHSPVVFVAALLPLLAACGGGGGGSTPPPPVADFSISVTPSIVSVGQGTAGATATVGVTGTGGFAGSVAVTLTGLPSGVTTSPASPFNVSADGRQVVTFAAVDSSTAGDTAITVTGQGGSRSHASSLTVKVVARADLPAAFRITYIRGDARRFDRTSFYHSGAFDPAHRLFFVANSGADRVDVISTTSLLLKDSIPVPQPMGVDVTPDGKVLIATATELLFVADPVTRQVTARVEIPDVHRAAYVTPYTFPTFVEATANGTALMRIDQVFSLNASALVQWDPAKGTFTDRTDEIGFVPT